MDSDVLVPVDGSENAWDALEYALEQYQEGSVTVLYVINPLNGDYELDETEEQAVKQSERIAEETRERADAAGADPELIEFVTREGRPAEEIVAHVDEQGIGQVVMGSRGLSGVKRLLLGSVAETVVRRADVPVNVVR
jgi:nucleotide-binding universal stress UspA family protein